MISYANIGDKIMYSLQTEFTCVECCKCATPFFITTRLNNSLMVSKESFYCPYGHSQSYIKSQKDIEIERLKNQLSQQSEVANREAESLRLIIKETTEKAILLSKELKQYKAGKNPETKKEDYYTELIGKKHENNWTWCQRVYWVLSKVKNGTRNNCAAYLIKHHKESFLDRTDQMIINLIGSSLYQLYKKNILTRKFDKKESGFVYGFNN